MLCAPEMLETGEESRDRGHKPQGKMMGMGWWQQLGRAGLRVRTRFKQSNQDFLAD